MPGVRVKENESFERALRRFRKRIEKKGILSDLRKHSRFERPSERKKRKRSAAKRKLRKLKLKQRRGDAR
jgi:small subunit ribosomal protein S21